MDWRRMFSVMHKEWRHITRDRASFALLLFSPVLFLLTMGYAFSIDIKNVDIAVLDHDLSPASREYIALLSSTDALLVQARPTSQAAVEQLMMQGRVRAAVIIPRGFSDALQSGQAPAVQLLIDGTDPNTAGHAIQFLSAYTEYYISRAEGVAALSPPIDLRIQAWYNPSLRYTVSIIPALVGVVLSVPAMAASLALAREREWGTLEGLIATPIRRGEVILGKLVPYVLAGLISVPLCLITAIYGYRVPFRGNLGLYLALSVVFLLATMSIALFISIFAKSQQVAIMASMIIFLFSGFFMSGLLIPFSVMGPLIKMEALLFPTTHFVIISRSFFVKGAGLSAVSGYVAALLALAVIFMALAGLMFKKKL